MFYVQLKDFRTTAYKNKQTTKKKKKKKEQNNASLSYIEKTQMEEFKSVMLDLIKF